MKIEAQKLWENKNQRNADKNQMEEIKRESDVLGYNLMKFNAICLSSTLKRYLNLGNMTQQT